MVTTTDREITLTRVFDAPRELVWKAWTQPEHLVNWFGPAGFSLTIQQIGVRPGGVWQFVMHGPDGTDYDNYVVFKDVEPPSRLHYRHGESADPSAHDFEATVTFEDEGGKTRLTLSTLFATAEAKRFAIEQIGAIEGGNQTLDRLGEYLSQIS